MARAMPLADSLGMKCYDASRSLSTIPLHKYSSRLTHILKNRSNQVLIRLNYAELLHLWQTISEPGPITFGLPRIQQSAYQKTRTALIRSNRLRCGYDPTSIQIRISEKWLAKNPKAFRTVEHILMEAFGGKARLANKINASRNLFCN